MTRVSMIAMTIVAMIVVMVKTDTSAIRIASAADSPKPPDEGKQAAAAKGVTAAAKAAAAAKVGEGVKQAAEVVKPPVNFYYSVRAGGTVYPEVHNLAGFAGVQGKSITNVAIRVDKGTVQYHVHVMGGGWLPYVTGCNWKDGKNGYAGNGKVIDAIQVIYTTPADILKAHGVQKAQYRVSPVKGNYWPWQYNNEKSSGQDGYAGTIGHPMDRFQIQ